MAKKRKDTGGKGHNKVASIAIILLGLFFSILGIIGIMQPYMNNTILILLFIGLILVLLGGILFKKSFLSKN